MMSYTIKRDGIIQCHRGTLAEAHTYVATADQPSTMWLRQYGQRMPNTTVRYEIMDTLTRQVITIVKSVARYRYIMRKD